MSKECAFCPHSAKLSAEHLWSDWMNALLKGKKRFVMRDVSGKVKATWDSTTLDWKAKVVCKKCNETWMSAIESQHAMPALTELIRGDSGVPVTGVRARSIALFAFKTAVLFDCIAKARQFLFFPRCVRHEFRKSLTIPGNVNIWLAHLAHGTGGGVTSWYHEGERPPTGRFEFYVCTYYVGHLVFQVVADRPYTVYNFSPIPGYEYKSLKFWPTPFAFVQWPPAHVMQTTDEVYRFSQRWARLTVTNPTVRG
jgi:hypothetical protein